MVCEFTIFFCLFIFLNTPFNNLYYFICLSLIIQVFCTYSLHLRNFSTYNSYYYYVGYCPGGLFDEFSISLLILPIFSLWKKIFVKVSDNKQAPIKTKNLDHIATDSTLLAQLITKGKLPSIGSLFIT